MERPQKQQTLGDINELKALKSQLEEKSPISLRIIGIDDSSSNTQAVQLLMSISKLEKDECATIIGNARKGTIQTIEIPLKTRIEQEKEAITALQFVGLIIG